MTADKTVFPNLFVLLVSPPGVGKTVAIDEVLDLWTATNMLNVAPASMTHKGLIDQLAISRPKNEVVDGQLIESRSLLIGVGELGVLLPTHDLAFLSALNDLYDCRNVFEEKIRSKEAVLKIPHPHIHMLAGTQPDYLGALLPDTAYGMGFMSRNLMVYQEKKIKPDLFAPSAKAPHVRRFLLEQLKKLCKLRGQVVWTQEAQVLLQTWVDQDEPPIPTHHKLVSYNARRLTHAIKLCIVLSASKRADMTITEDDFTDALTILIDAEQDMPRVFAEMSHESNNDQIQEVWQWILKQYNLNGPVHEVDVIRKISSMVMSYQIQPTFKALIDGGLIANVGVVNVVGERQFKPVLRGFRT